MIKRTVEFLFECIGLKDVKREWWRCAWIQFPESIAEHTMHSIQIGFILAELENVNVNKVVNILIWHDIAEIRIWDIHWLWWRYIKDKHKIEDRVINEQLKWLSTWKKIKKLINEYNERKTKESIIAKDADTLNMVFQCKIYLEQWYDLMETYLKNFEWRLVTKSAKKLYKDITNSKSYNWILDYEADNYWHK